MLQQLPLHLVHALRWQLICCLTRRLGVLQAPIRGTVDRSWPPDTGGQGAHESDRFPHDMNETGIWKCAHERAAGEQAEWCLIKQDSRP
jgi:hypothetical protein